MLGHASVPSIYADVLGCDVITIDTADTTCDDEEYLDPVAKVAMIGASIQMAKRFGIDRLSVDTHSEIYIQRHAYDADVHSLYAAFWEEHRRLSLLFELFELKT